jgi:hypothetical protein
MKRLGKPDSSSDTDGATPARNRSRSRQFKILCLAFGLLLFVILDLVCASIVFDDQQKSFRRPHPYYHHGLRADQNRLTQWGGHRYRMITNSLAMRDSETRDVPLQSDAPRAVLMGDSMIEGLGVDYDESVAGQLEQLWQPRGVEILNAGVVSYSPHLYSLKTRYLLEEVGLEFDQLIVFIDISDIQDETFYEAFQPKRDENNLLKDWWRRHSLMWRVADLFASPAPRFTNQFRTDAEVNVWMEATEAYHGDIDPEIGRWRWTIDEALYELWGKKGLTLARKHMLELSELCRDHQIELTVVIYPSPTQIFANDEDSIQRRFWQEFCDDVDVTLIDLFPVFIDRSYSGPREVYRRFYFPSDSHWNRAGHQIVADRVDKAVGARITAEP